MRTYNAYQELAYKAIFRPVARPKVISWSLCYGKIIIQDSASYGLLQAKMKELKRYGKFYPVKELFKIIPART